MTVSRFLDGWWLVMVGLFVYGGQLWWTCLFTAVMGTGRSEVSPSWENVFGS